MAIKLNEENEGKLVSIEATGKLVKADYDLCIPIFERLIKEHGKLKVLLDIRDFHGWGEGAALWEEIKFDVKHFKDFERIAVVGDKTWHHAMTTVSKPLTPAAVRYFDKGESEQAMIWLKAA